MKIFTQKGMIKHLKSIKKFQDMLVNGRIKKLKNNKYILIK